MPKYKKPLFNQISIVGVGLIGGSLGLAIKKRRLSRWVVGVVRRDETAKQAVRVKAVDAATKNLKEGVRGADLVILCAPVSTITQQLKTLDKLVAPGALVIDVGSSKETIEMAAAQYLKKTQFVGCHPMAGSEKCGIEFASEGLFQDAICFMTRKNKKVEMFWKSLGSKPVPIKTKDHDAWVAKSSHLPHAISFALFQNINSRHPHNPSLRDMARLANSHADLWADIFLSNQKNVLNAADEFRKSLFTFQQVLRTKNKASLVRFIRHANQRSS